MRLTKEGRRLVIATALISITALNTGNNLIYLILSLLLSIIFISIIILRNNMKNLTLNVIQNKPIFANTPSEILLRLKNMKGFPARSIKVLSSSGMKEDAYFPEILPYKEIFANVNVIFKKRGLYKYGDFYLESGYPFIFFKRTILCNVKGEIIVYPEIKEQSHFLQSYIREGQESISQKIGEGEDFSMVREFRYGDDSRKIHWKASAKTEKLLVMEYDASEIRKLTIILDNLDVPDKYDFEKAVSFAASVADYYITQGYYVRLLTCGKVVPFGIGQEHLFKILDVLAVIESKSLWECPLTFYSDGITLLILNSYVSSMNKFISSADMVFYAQDL